MSPNAVAHDSAEECFAGLLEHLTRHSRPEPASAESRPHAASRTSPASASISGSDARSGTRSLLAVTELKAGRGTAAPESTPLSYEQALRLHARPRTAQMGNLDLPDTPPSGIAPSQRETTPDPRLNKDNATRKDPPVHPGESFAHSQSASQPTPETQGIPKTPARRRVKPGIKSPSKAKVQAKSRRGNYTADQQHLGDSQGSASTVSPSLPSAQFLSETVSRPEGKPQLKSKLKSNSKTGSSTARPGGTRNLPRLGRRDLHWNPAAPMDLMSPGDLVCPAAPRRAIVSLRLTDSELLRLKDRAGESGISVSAYMRSCIIDADQLRTQVKQALAELRALSARPEPSRVPALAPPESSGSGNGGDWFRLLARSAAFLLNPLFPFRRSA